MKKLLFILFLITPLSGNTQTLTNEKLKINLPEKIQIYINIFNSGDFDGKESIFYTPKVRGWRSFPKKWGKAKSVYSQHRLAILEMLKAAKSGEPHYFYNKDRKLVHAYYDKISFKVVDNIWYLKGL